MSGERPEPRSRVQRLPAAPAPEAPARLPQAQPGQHHPSLAPRCFEEAQREPGRGDSWARQPGLRDERTGGGPGRDPGTGGTPPTPGPGPCQPRAQQAGDTRFTHPRFWLEPLTLLPTRKDLEKPAVTEILPKGSGWCSGAWGGGARGRDPRQGPRSRRGWTLTRPGGWCREELCVQAAPCVLFTGESRRRRPGGPAQGRWPQRTRGKGRLCPWFSLLRRRASSHPQSSPCTARVGSTLPLPQGLRPFRGADVHGPAPGTSCGPHMAALVQKSFSSPNLCLASRSVTCAALALLGQPARDDSMWQSTGLEQKGGADPSRSWAAPRAEPSARRSAGPSAHLSTRHLSV